MDKQEAIGQTFEAEIGNVMEGWRPLVRDLHERLLALDPNYDLRQIKEKFGGLRYYFATASPLGAEMRELAYKAEARSFTICEVCGEPGARVGGGWIKTLCDVHTEAKEIAFVDTAERRSE